MTMRYVLQMALVCVTVLAAGYAQVAANDATTPPSSALRPGGDATSTSQARGKNAFSQSSGNLSFEEQLTFKLGNAIFRKLWVSAPASTKSSDGLGPRYNARSCQRCHLKDGRGHPPKANWPEDNAISMLLRLSIAPRNAEERARLASGRVNQIPSPKYGGQLQDFAIQGHDVEGRFDVTYRDKTVSLADGTKVTLRDPEYTLRDLKFGSPAATLMTSPRIAPQMIGLGLLEAIAERDVRANEDPEDRDGNGVSGRANRVWSSAAKTLELGRFGWKAGVPTLRQQAAEAFSGDIGISSSLVPAPFGDCTKAQAVCRGAPHGDDNGSGFEVNDDLLDLVTFYTRHLAVPRRRNTTEAKVITGEKRFREIGCVACHTPSFKTSPDAQDPRLRGQTIWPYSDLLLHDMGDGLADNRPEGKASGREWRTPPLWGIGLTQAVNGHTFFLHDGRARNIAEAILWHGGEAQKSRDAFAALTASDRDALIAFVNSL